MSQVRFTSLLFALAFVGTSAFAVSEYAGVPNAVTMTLTGLQVLCCVVMIGLIVIVATTTKLDTSHSEDDSG